MSYTANQKRYETMTYNRCGKSGLKLPKISMGLWHNFGSVDDFDNARKMLLRSFDLGITHFDLANNYGPEGGSAEVNFGKVLKKDLMNYRNELIISTKAGHYMWPGLYGEWGSRKYLLASLDESLKRMGLDYVDIFYSHRPDPNTPLEETMGALDSAVRQGKALYAGISSYSAPQTAQSADILKALGTPCLIHQPSYSMFDRWVEGGLLDVLEEKGIGCIAFCPLAQGMLTNKYLHGIPENSRAAKAHGFLQRSQVTEKVIEKATKLNEIAKARGQSLAQMALVWVLKDKRITSALIGASKIEQIEDCLKALEKPELSPAELQSIEQILKS
ncbi:MAG: L-glyceraldehyde 3-phosphate reductase [Phycisphaerae bacterium]|nr:L-glyceraldehyde 3-phosphate reductase [Phycisphaerae bacterium]